MSKTIEALEERLRKVEDHVFHRHDKDETEDKPDVTEATSEPKPDESAEHED